MEAEPDGAGWRWLEAARDCRGGDPLEADGGSMRL